MITRYARAMHYLLTQLKGVKMATKEAYVQKLHAKIDEWNAEIDKLKAKSDSVKAEKKAEYQKELETLRSRREELKEKVDQLSGAGENAWQACDQIVRVVQCARQRRIPVIYTRHTQRNLKFDGFAAKTRRDPSNYLEGSKGVQIIEALSPAEGDIIVDKQYSSAFYGTPLQSYLIKLGVDTLVVTGGTTSGCVRAFCVDAVSRNFNVALLEDAVFDRISASHKIALLDLWMKYCDVIPAQAGLDYLMAF